MILLDTDHLSVLTFSGSPGHQKLIERMDAEIEEEFATTIVSIEEELRGWLAYIKKQKDVSRETIAYQRLWLLFDFFASWSIVLFDEKAVQMFKQLRGSGIRIGTMDLKIASIALVNDCLLLSANEKDFRQVPDLEVQNWMV